MSVFAGLLKLPPWLRAKELFGVWRALEAVMMMVMRRPGGGSAKEGGSVKAVTGSVSLSRRLHWEKAEGGGVCLSWLLFSVMVGGGKVGSWNVVLKGKGGNGHQTL